VYSASEKGGLTEPIDSKRIRGSIVPLTLIERAVGDWMALY
jgi:hypothetical protein